MRRVSGSVRGESMKRSVQLLLLLCAGISNAADMYIRDESLSSAGAYLVDEVHVPPRFLVDRFGAPSIGDGIRVSGQYTFRSKEGVVFTIHDYKSTTLWVTDEGLPTPETFWRLTEPVELSIGARGNDATEFKKWVLGEYSAWLKRSRVLPNKTVEPTR